MQAPHKVVFKRRSGERWLDVTCSEFLAEVHGVAKGLMAAGVGVGDRVGLMSKTRYEWTLIDFAIWTAGAVTVPIYETSSAEQVQWILGDSGAVACLVESPDHLAVVDEVRGDLRQARQRLDDRHRGDSTSSPAPGRRSTTRPSRPGVRRPRPATWPPSSTPRAPPAAPRAASSPTPTSCSRPPTSRVKDSDATLANVFQDEGASTLLFLPLAHVFARIIEVGVVMARAELGHTADVKNLLADLATFRPTFILSVPRVFEKVYNSSEQKAEAAGKGKIFDAAADTAIAFSEARDQGGAGLGLKAKHARLRPARLRQAARRPRRPGALRGLRRRAAR